MNRRQKWLAIVTAIGLSVCWAGLARARNINIIGWKRHFLALRQAVGAPVEHVPSSQLHLPVPIDGEEQNFLRFTDPATQTSWLISRFDVETDEGRETSERDEFETCVRMGPQGFGERCP